MKDKVNRGVDEHSLCCSTAQPPMKETMRDKVNRGVDGHSLCCSAAHVERRSGTKTNETKVFDSYDYPVLWSKTARNPDVSTGPLARPFALSLALLTRLHAPLTRSHTHLTCSLAPPCLLRSRDPLRSLIRLLAHFAHSLARGKVND